MAPWEFDNVVFYAKSSARAKTTCEKQIAYAREIIVHDDFNVKRYALVALESAGEWRRMAMHNLAMIKAIRDTLEG